MDEFLSIDWNPPLEDMLVTRFVDTERLQKESSMYKILQGTFKDPFDDVYKDYYDSVTDEMMEQVITESNEQKKQERLENIAKQKNELPTEVEKQEKMSYIPGFGGKKPPVFPRPSKFNAEEQALCLRVLIRFSSSQKPEISSSVKEELQTYMNLMPAISKEQDEYLEFAKSLWDGSKLKICEEDYINAQWKKKITLINNLPRYYTENGSIPFISSIQIALNYHSTCLEMGTLPKTILPRLTKRFKLPCNTTLINQRYFTVNTNDESRKPMIFKTPVSQDPNCDILAKEHDIDMVISSGGLNCLAVNIDPNNKTSWILPIVVKRVNEKNVVFVDKPLPPTGSTVIEKNTWLYKYRLKVFTNHPYHIKAINLNEESTERLSLRRQFPHWDSSESITCPKTEEESDESMQIDKTDGNDSQEDAKKIEENNDKFVRPPPNHNLFYRLFRIGSSDDSQSELMKNRIEKVYKLLVRSKSDGASKIPSGEHQMMMVAPKLEHQLEMGAEAVTTEEAAKQWMSLTFRPDTTLARVRIDAQTSEVIQVEKRTSTSINNEIKRLYNLKTEAALALLYNVTETMTRMNPGRYLMRHTVRNGAFATIYKEVDGPGKNVLDLQTVYCEDEFRTIPNSSWPMLDKLVTTPALQHFQRMPALFRPCIVGKNKKGGKKKNKQQAKAVRKSARTKGTTTPE